MDKIMTFKYDPELNDSVIEEIFKRKYPEYKISHQVKILRLCKSPYVHAAVFIKQKPKKDVTTVKVYGQMSFWAFYLFGFIIHYVLRGGFVEEVFDVVKEELTRRFQLLDEKNTIL